MKFEIRKYDFEQALEEFRVNIKGLEMAQIKVAQLITNESGFSLTQEPLTSTQMTSSQDSIARRAAGYSEYDELNDEMDLLEHLNVDQHGNNQEKSSETAEVLNSQDQEFANSLKFLSERFSRIILWFDTKDSRKNYTFTPKELIEEFHQTRFIDQSLINSHKPATNDRETVKRRVVQDANRLRKALSRTMINRPDYIKFSDETTHFLEDLDLTLSILYADDYQFIDDYKITLKTIPFEPSPNLIAQMQQRTQISTNIRDDDDNNNDEWIDTRSQSTQFKRRQTNVTQTTFPIHTQLLTLYCLSPSVAFAKDLRLARSLVFASGTLAPLATYAGELKIPFDIQLECNHVIDLDRTFITALSHGRSSNIRLRATYQNTDKPEFQDECGFILLDICQRVPYGILCFVPSYRFLNVITNRWMTSGLWQKLNEYKSVFFEEQSNANFQNTINRFREANGTLKITKEISTTAKRVKEMFKRQKTSEQISTETTNSSYFPCKGGLLLAVCRGRASEGIDFSDNNARCVITLGIPYPNVQNEEVCFKRNYNNEQNKRMPQVMNGSDWYDSQAYRALNQALGRCIRHKNDWGALIIVEERIVNNITDKNFTNKISLWIKQRLSISRGYDETMSALERFVENMQKSDEISMLERQQQELNEESEKKVNHDEQRRLELVLPPLQELPKKTESIKPNYRQWNVDDVIDDENMKEDQAKPNHKRAFEKFIAQRQMRMTPPSVRLENISITEKEKPVKSAFNDNKKYNRSRSNRVRERRGKTFFSQRPVSISSQPVLSQKFNSSETQPEVIHLIEDDDNDDFVGPAISSSYKSTKKVRLA